MIFRFKKGRHRARPLYWLKWWALLLNLKVIERVLEFTDNSFYLLDGGDQEDQIKIFGIRFGFKETSPSARFTYYYDIDKNVYNLYWYRRKVDGKFDFGFLISIEPNIKYRLRLSLTEYSYNFQVLLGKAQIAGMVVEKDHNKKSGFLLGPYFGGNRTSPRTHEIKLSKV